jgi:hypothetical protein
MARVTYGSLVTKFQGSIGGTTFQNVVSGNVARNKQFKGPRRTALNVASSEVFKRAALFWQSITVSEREDFATMAANNDFYTLWNVAKKVSGFTWFMSGSQLNYIVNAGSFDIVAYDPAPSMVCPGLSVVATSSTLVASLASLPSVGDYILLYATPVLKSATINNRLNYRYLQFEEESSYASMDIKASFEAVYKVNWSTVFNDYQGYIVFYALTYSSDTPFRSPFAKFILPINQPT